MRLFVFLISSLLLTSCVHKDLIEQRAFSRTGHIDVPLTASYWKVEYDGGGAVRFAQDGSHDLVLEPQTPQRSDQTFAALVLLKPTLLAPLTDYVVHLEVTTSKQLRAQQPNDWEVFWFFSNYRAESPNSKEANYFILKPANGAELGRAFQNVGQHFIKTDTRHTLELNKRQRFTYVKEGGRFRVYRDRDLILDYSSPERGTSAEGLYDHAGALGLYTEDAQVRVHSFSYRSL